jgi:hypothetical protein
VPKPMKRRDVERALRRANCTVLREGKEHTVWICSCGGDHKAAVPRHGQITAGVVGNIGKAMACQGKGWLQ